MQANAVKKPVEKPKFDNPRMDIALLEFEEKIGKKDLDGACGVVRLECRGKNSERLLDYAIGRLNAVGAEAEANALKGRIELERAQKKTKARF